jgi:signal transduction histidine kinase
VREELLEDDDQDDDDDRLDEGGHTPAGILAHELEDVKLEGARASLWMDGRRVAGALDLPALAANECEKLTVHAHVIRACTMPVGAHATVTLAITTQAEQARSNLLVRALSVGTLGGALLGGLLSYFLARWAIAPLNRLRDGVRRIQPESPQITSIREPVPQLEVEELRLAVLNLIERLAAALSHAQAFAAEAAHELRTPLTTIAGELELLIEEASPAAEALTRTREQVLDLTALVQRLLALAQARPLAVGEGEVVDLSDVVALVEQALSTEERARVQSSCADDVLVAGDAALLRSLLSNAVGNALKFSSGLVRISLSGDGERALLDVIDSGPGVSAAEREQVFVPFYRSSAVRASGTKGHGLGLALIASVARRHHGKAAFLPAVSGAHLRIELPRLAMRPSRLEDVEAPKP